MDIKSRIDPTPAVTRRERVSRSSRRSADLRADVQRDGVVCRDVGGEPPAGVHGEHRPGTGAADLLAVDDIAVPAGGQVRVVRATGDRSVLVVDGDVPG